MRVGGRGFSNRSKRRSWRRTTTCRAPASSTPLLTTHSTPPSPSSSPLGAHKPTGVRARVYTHTHCSTVDTQHGPLQAPDVCALHPLRCLLLRFFRLGSSHLLSLCYGLDLHGLEQAASGQPAGWYPYRPGRMATANLTCAHASGKPTFSTRVLVPLNFFGCHTQTQNTHTRGVRVSTRWRRGKEVLTMIPRKRRCAFGRSIMVRGAAGLPRPLAATRWRPLPLPELIVR